MRATKDDTVSTRYAYSCLPILFSPGNLLLRDITEELSAEDLVCALRQKGSLFVEKGTRGFAAVSVTSPDAVMDASVMVQLLQKHTGTYIACLEEIAWRRGMIGAERLNQLGQARKETAYGAYILSLAGPETPAER